MSMKPVFDQAAAILKKEHQQSWYNKVSRLVKKECAEAVALEEKVTGVFGGKSITRFFSMKAAGVYAAISPDELLIVDEKNQRRISISMQWGGIVDHWDGEHIQFVDPSAKDYKPKDSPQHASFDRLIAKFN